MKNLEDAVVRAMNRMPELAESILKITVQVGRILDDVESKKLPETASSTLTHINQAVTTLQTMLVQVNAGKLSAQTQEALANLNVTLTRANGILAKVDGEKGILASATRATNAVGDVAIGAGGLSKELEATMRDIQTVTAAIQRLADALERDPDMLLKGRGKSK